jgi:hypothetical protein
MPTKKNLSSAKKSTNAVKRHAKLTVPKGQKVSSMKAANIHDIHVTKPVDNPSPN